jgi:DNA modification methylase
MTDIDDWTSGIHVGDAEATLAAMPSDSVHMCMTSPPYFGLRDYGEDGQIGLEDSLDEYIAELVAVFEEIRRVLRPDGSAWLNLGDSYATARRDHTGGDQVGGAPTDDYATREQGALGRKNKMLVPHRVAIALQEAGWIVRNDVTWVKPNPMPSSVKDRLNTTTEQIFHLTPNPDYYYDLDAIREPYSEASKERYEHGYDGSIESASHQNQAIPDGDISPNSNGKNPGDVFEVTTKPFPDAHFAVYPPELCEKPIKSTCPPGGIVLDPFAGAGTTCLVAKELDRRFIGVDLNPEYVAMAQKRLGLDVHDPSLVREAAEAGLEAFET